MSKSHDILGVFLDLEVYFRTDYLQNFTGAEWPMWTVENIKSIATNSAFSGILLITAN